MAGYYFRYYRQCFYGEKDYPLIMKEFLGVIFLILAAAIMMMVLLSRIEIPQPTPGTTTSFVTTTTVHGYHFPITNYTLRKGLRDFGKLVTPGDAESLDCGAAFSGYHTADDLEIFPAEADLSVPVFAFADGTVSEVQTVSGYGGLLVLKSQVEGMNYNAYYGHLDLTTVAKKAGQAVSSGEKIAELGKGCSSESGGERKHLHFGISKGEWLDYRGYVETASELENWLDPTVFLTGLSAKEPQT